MPDTAVRIHGRTPILAEWMMLCGLRFGAQWTPREIDILLVIDFALCSNAVSLLFYRCPS